MHPIGRAIFVFAGSTYSSFKDSMIFVTPQTFRAVLFQGWIRAG
jgi:hypothetical protein